MDGRGAALVRGPAKRRGSRFEASVGSTVSRWRILRGEWERTPRLKTHRTCDELLSYEPHCAGMAFNSAGEVPGGWAISTGAEAAFARAHELGHEPQPGLALIQLARGRTEAAAGGAEARARHADASASELFARATARSAASRSRSRTTDLETAARRRRRSSGHSPTASRPPCVQAAAAGRGRRPTARGRGRRWRRPRACARR